MYKKRDMLSANVTDFRKEMKKYLDLVIENYETLIINRGKGKGAVMISLDEYNSLMETMYLLSSKANADHLYESMKQFREGRVVEKDLGDL
jgi:antitoxin YefM